MFRRRKDVCSGEGKMCVKEKERCVLRRRKDVCSEEGKMCVQEKERCVFRRREDVCSGEGNRFQEKGRLVSSGKKRCRCV